LEIALEWPPGSIDPPKYEIIGGRVYQMAGANTRHNAITLNLARIFANYLLGKKCRAFLDGTKLYFENGDHLLPDMMIVCNPEIIKYDGIYGTPDLVVEILSPSTTKRDKGVKKDLYEHIGVSEYWIIDPNSLSIEIYLLKNGKYVFGNAHTVFPEREMRSMYQREIDEIEHDFKTSLFDDLVINVRDVFEHLIEDEI